MNMKRLVLGSLTAFTASTAMSTHAALYTFEAANEFSSNFAGSSGFSQSATGGLTNSGSVALGSTSTIAVEQLSFDATAGGFTISAFFKYNGANDDGRGFAIGVTSGASDTYSNSATTTGTDLRVTVNGIDGAGNEDKYGIQILNNGSAIDTSSLNVVLTSGNFYQVKLNVGGVSGGSFTGITAELLTEAGSSLKLLDNGGGGGYTTVTTLTTDAEAYAFFGGQNPTTRAASHVDNFSTPSIPEPASLALMGLGGLLMLSCRRHAA